MTQKEVEDEGGYWLTAFEATELNKSVQPHSILKIGDGDADHGIYVFVPCQATRTIQEEIANKWRRFAKTTSKLKAAS